MKKRKTCRGSAGIIVLAVLLIGQTGLFMADYLDRYNVVPIGKQESDTMLASKQSSGKVLGSRDLALSFNLGNIKKRIRDFLDLNSPVEQDVPQPSGPDQPRDDEGEEVEEDDEGEDQTEEITPTPTPQPVELKGTTEISSDPSIVIQRINKRLTLKSVLGDSIDSSEIEDGTITEPDLKISNPPVGSYLLSSDGADGFTWVEQEEAELKKLADLTDVRSLDYTAGYVLRADGSGYKSAKLSLSDLTFTAGDHLTLDGNKLNVDDDFVKNSGDSMSGELVFYNASSSSSTEEGAVYYNLDDDNLYVYTSAGFVDLTSQGEIYTAGSGIEISDSNVVSLTESGLSQEEVDDYINELLNDTDSVHTLITVTYDDTNDAMDFVVDDDLSLYDNSTSAFITDDTSVDKNHLNNSGTLSFDWSDGEVTDDLTVSSSGSVDDDALSSNVSLLGQVIETNEVVTAITLDSEWDSLGEIETATGKDIIDSTENSDSDDDLSDDNIGALSNVSITGWSVGEYLRYNGSNLVDSGIDAGDISSGTLSTDRYNALSDLGGGSGNTYLQKDGSWSTPIWMLSGDSGTAQSVGTGNTALFTGGAGIDTSVGATDELTLAFNATELSDLTWGSGSPFTWTLDVGDTDPEIFADSNVLGITNANVGIGTTNPGAKLEIAGSGTSTISNTSGDIVIDPSGGNILPGSGVESDNTVALGSASVRWSDLYVVNSHVGDLWFANQFAITEFFKYDQNPSGKGIVFVDENREELMRLDKGGNLSVKGTITGNVGIGDLQDRVEEVGVKLNELSQQIDNQQSLAEFEMTEVYQSREELSGGKIVVVDDQPEANYGVKKSTKEFENGMLGVVVDKKDKGYQIGIAGRVKVKVILPVGTSIEPGDYITTSQYPGIGQKVKQEGLVLGTALEAMKVEDCDQENEECDWVEGDQGTKYPVKEINVLINPMWYNGRDDQLLPSGASTEVTAGDIDLEMIESLDLSGDLSVYGETFLADTTVSGNLNVGFTQIKDGEITVLGKERELKLQAMTGAGNVNVFDGKILLTPEGVVIAKELKVDKAEVKDLQVDEGITLKDKSTGEPYCVYVENGQVKSDQGNCIPPSNAELTSTPTPTVEPEPEDSDNVTPTVTPEVEQ